MRYLGIDYGKYHLGFSISEGSIAAPYLSKQLKGQGLKVQSQKQKLRIITEITIQEKIGTVILGIPEGEIAGEIKQLGKQITRLTNLKVIFQDETLTSREAVKKMIEAGKKRTDRKKKEHNTAACIILQNYLDQV